MPADAPSLRETLTSAMEASTTATEAPAEVVETVTEAPVTEATLVEVETAEAKAERVRDEAGRFAKGDKKSGSTPGDAARKPAGTPAAPGKAAAEVAPPAPAAAEPVKPEPKPDLPRSLSLRARELAAKAPAEFKPLLDEVAKRDVETTRALNESHQARQFAAQVQESLRPYEGIARANGTDAMTWAGQALQERAAVMNGAPQHAVAVVAGAVQMLTQRFGPQAIDMISAALQGQPAQAMPQHQAPVDVDGAVQKALEARIAAMSEQRGLTEAQAWLDARTPEEQAEIPELMPAMIGIIQAAKESGAKMTYDEAYAQSRWANPVTRTRLMEQERAQKAAASTAAATAAAQKAKAAAVSIKGQPAPAVSQRKGPRSVREELEDAMVSNRT